MRQINHIFNLGFLTLWDLESFKFEVNSFEDSQMQQQIYVEDINEKFQFKLILL